MAVIRQKTADHIIFSAVDKYLLPQCRSPQPKGPGTVIRMALPMSAYSFLRYLRAKKTVDDRALNARVWARLAEYLAGREELRILEAGAGSGTMIERLVENGLLSSCEYTAVDASPENITALQTSAPVWGAAYGFAAAQPEPGIITLSNGDLQVRLVPVVEDVFDYLVGDQTPGWDVLIAHAFLDLVDLPTALSILLGALLPGGVFYFSINFDGLTALEPVVDPEYDARILMLYHASMDTRRRSSSPSGSSRTGRQLFTAIREAGAQILAAGSSDWVVFPHGSGYPDDEAYFLHFIIHTIDQELNAHPELDRRRFDRWITTRHNQIDGGELVYLAHQIDFFGMVP
jgi:SAM-dependent methyltransferase